MSGDSGKESNYWPAFVDALSNVVLTLVFVLVVFVFALVLASNKVESKAKEMVREAQEQALRGDSSQIVTTIKMQLEEAQKKIEDLSKANELLREKTSILEKSTIVGLNDNVGLRAVGAGNSSLVENKIVVVFPTAISDLDADSLKNLDRLLDAVKKDTPHKSLSLHAYIGLETYSAARRLSYYRILGLRKHLLDREEFKNVKIENRILIPKEAQDGRVEIIINEE